MYVLRSLYIELSRYSIIIIGIPPPYVKVLDPIIIIEYLESSMYKFLGIYMFYNSLTTS